MDVVEADPKDWTRDPFTLIEEDGYFYARGASDDKAQASIWTDLFVRFKREGYRPRRTLKLALTCLVARGHLLIEDIPGVGKTTLALGLARVLGPQVEAVGLAVDLHGHAVPRRGVRAGVPGSTSTIVSSPGADTWCSVLALSSR